MKSPEELNALKEEFEDLNKKLAELSKEELAAVSGGFIPPLPRGQAEIKIVKEFTGAI